MFSLDIAHKSLLWLQAFCFATIIIGMIRGEQSVTNYFTLQASRNRLSLHIQELEKDIKGLQSEIEKIKKSKSYAQKVLKDKHHLAGPHEKIIFFAD